MPIAVRIALAVIVGIIVGSIVNMAFVQAGPLVIPLPEDADVSTPEGLRESMALFTPANFLFPFLGHAVGTLAGAFVAAKLSPRHRMRVAMGLGVFFLVGGIAAVLMFGGPLWFQATDLIAAYLPVAWLGGRFAGRGRAGAVDAGAGPNSAAGRA